MPTDFSESDGTPEWNSTTLVFVQATSDNKIGLGYSYADDATARLIENLLSEVVRGQDALAPGANWNAMVARTRNLGRPGIVSMAVSAVDIALWDLKARLLDLPLVTLLGAVRKSVLIYGSGGFTSYSDEQLERQLSGWVEEGISRVKMKSAVIPQPTRGGWKKHGPQLVPTRSCSSMRTGRTAGSKPWILQRNLRT